MNRAVPCRVVVCIPTYRRVEKLKRLLVALSLQRGVERFDILVGNNECSDLLGSPRLDAAALPAFSVINVETRGVSAVRNAMVAEVLGRGDAVKWIACIDDDQEPADDWLAALLAAGDLHDADMVGGPVRKMVEVDTPWSNDAADTSYLPKVGGVVTTLNEAGNLLLSTRYLRALERPPFRLDFGRTGGEDYEFFLHARSKGAAIVWAPDARVTEVLPYDRLTLRGYTWRFYSIAAYQARADRQYHGSLFVLRTVVVEMGKAPGLLLRSLLRERNATRAAGVVIKYSAATIGRLAGLVGVRAERYGADGHR